MEISSSSSSQLELDFFSFYWLSRRARDLPSSNLTCGIDPIAETAKEHFRRSLIRSA
jgi:hypothetical protein